MTKQTFEQYLMEVAVAKGWFEGVLDDNYEDRFDAWLETQDVNNIMDYAQKWGNTLVA